MISIAGRSYLLWIEVIAICAWLLVWEFPLVTNGLCGRAIATEFQESTLVDFDYSAVLTDLPCSGITTGLHWSAAAELGDESLSPWLSFADALYYDLMRPIRGMASPAWGVLSATLAVLAAAKAAWDSFVELPVPSKQENKKDEAGPARDRWYQESIKQRTNRLQKMNQKRTEYSFDPVLATAKSRLAMKVTAMSAGERCQRAKHKAKKTADTMYGECTFKPNMAMTKDSNAAVMNKKVEQRSVVDRLYKSAEEQRVETKRREAERASKMLSECTFKPPTRGSRKKGDALEEPSPVYERLHGMNWEVQQKREKKRQNEEPRDPNWTFQPLLTKCPEKIRAKLAADGRDERGTRRMERMYKLGRERQLERSRSSPDYTTASALCTFKPDLSATARSPLKAGKRGHSAFKMLHAGRNTSLSAAKNDDDMRMDVQDVQLDSPSRAMAVGARAHDDAD